MSEAMNAPRQGRCRGGRFFSGFLRGRRSERGASLVEFALVAVPFFFLTFGTMELGLVLWGTYELENATEDAARMIRTGQVHSQNIDADGFRLLVCERVVLLSQCETRLRLDVRTYASFSDIKNDNFQPLDPQSGQLGNAFEWQQTEPRSIVLVRTFYPWPLFMGITSAVLANMAGGSRLLWATAVFRNESWPV
jgi:Flp pilus assembly protein TadG